MESEKVKEIKECLEVLNEYGETYITKDKTQRKFVKYADILTYINELESENERLDKSDTSKEESSIEYYNLYKDFKRENQQLKERIAELEKENAKYKQKLTTNQWVQEIRKEALKQFAERLKEQMNEGEYIGEKYKLSVFRDIDIDKTLKEFIK